LPAAMPGTASFATIDAIVLPIAAVVSTAATSSSSHSSGCFG